MFNWSTYTGNLEWLQRSTIFLTRAGSWSYGTNTPESDEDFRGIAIPPKEYFYGFLKRFDQAEWKEPDTTIFDIRKFFELAANANPNVLEILFTDPADHVLRTRLGDLLIAHRHLFLSRKVRHTFAGYSFAQLKRIKLHRHWLMNPREIKPLRTDFGLPEQTVIGADILGAMDSVLTTNEQVDFPPHMMEIYQKERSYQGALREYQQYQNWKTTRNKTRAALEAHWGYDCYEEESTEFLTNEGWKFFSEIDDNLKLGTVDIKTGQFEFQKPTEKIRKLYSGIMYNFSAKGTQAVVTAEHNLLISDMHRSKANNFSVQYEDTIANWRLVPAIGVDGDYRSCYHVRRAPSVGKKEDYEIDDDLLILLGLFVSDGTVQFYKGLPKNVVLSKQPNTPFAKFADQCVIAFGGSKHTYDKETRWSFKKKEAAWLYDQVGHGSKNKKLPNWTLYLSERQVRLLWNVLLVGDGTENHQRKVFCTTSERLANDIQAMLIVGGIHAVKYGPYTYDTGFKDKVTSFQVVVSKIFPLPIVSFYKREMIPLLVNQKTVVCFTVPNGTLVTRNSGFPAVQGNCKHACHLIRLARMGKEVLTTGQVVVKRPDAEELLAIRNQGIWSYDQIVAYAENLDVEMEELEKNSPLPKSPDRNKLDELCQRMVEEFLEKE